MPSHGRAHCCTFHGDIVLSVERKRELSLCTILQYLANPPHLVDGALAPLSMPVKKQAFPWTMRPHAPLYTHKRATAVWQTPLCGRFAFQSPKSIGDGLSKRLPLSGGMFANSFLLPCRHSCKSGYADCLRGVLCGLCQVTTVGPIICQYRRPGLQPIFHISCFRVLYPGPHRLYSIIMQNKKDSTDNCDSCPASHTDSRHGHFPSLNVSVVDSTTDIVRATQPAWRYI